MATVNPWKKLIGLLPGGYRTVGEVISVDIAAGTSVVELCTGTRVLARGTSVAAGQNAFLVDGQVMGQAPSLPQYDLHTADEGIARYIRGARVIFNPLVLRMPDSATFEAMNVERDDALHLRAGDAPVHAVQRVGAGVAEYFYLGHGWLLGLVVRVKSLVRPRRKKPTLQGGRPPLFK